MSKEQKIGYIRKTGHQYFGTFMEAYESTDNCGTCDGARCDICKDMYCVEDFNNDKLLYYGKDKDMAISIAGYNFIRGVIMEKN